MRPAESQPPATPAPPRGFVAILRRTWSEFSAAEGTLRAAALCYYSVFALPPLLIVLITIAGLLWNPAQVESALEHQFSGLVGAEGAKMVRGMVSGVKPGSGSTLAAVLGVAGIIFGATGVFLSLQDALNKVWDVKPDPSAGGVRNFITKRLMSFGMTMGVAFLLVVSLALTAAITALGSTVGTAGVAIEIANNVFDVVILGLLFATMFMVLPDARVSWRDVWVGGFATALLLEVGRFVIGLYLGRSNPGHPFGAASALAVILVWLYYAGILVLIGAEFTRQWANAHGRGSKPEPGAMKVEPTERVVSKAS